MNKKSQLSLEALLIISFIIFFLSITLYFFSYFFVNFEEDKNEKEILDFANSIVFQVELLSKLEEGYTREFNVSKNLAYRYGMQYDKKSNIILFRENVSDYDSKIHYFFLPENVEITQTTLKDQIVFLLER